MKSKYKAIIQYGDIVQWGWRPGNSVKVDGEYFPEPNFITRNAYFTIDGVRYEGIYEK